MSLYSTNANYGGRQPTYTSYIKQFVESVDSVIDWIFVKQNNITYIEPSVTNYPILIPQNVIMNNNLTVYGTFSNPSDERIKTDIKDINPQIADKLFILHPHQYKLRNSSPFHLSNNNNNNNNNIIENQGSQQPIQYGLIAQEVETIYPELVLELENGLKTINYIQLIPLLLYQIQKLNNEVLLLKNNNTFIPYPTLNPKSTTILNPKSTKNILSQIWDWVKNYFSELMETDLTWDK